MMNTSPPQTLFWLQRHVIERVLEDHCWSQEALADEVGISRVHFNRLLNGHRPLTRRTRRKLLDCAVLQGLSPDELWARTPASEG